MKKLVLLFATFCVLAGAAGAQQIRKSPFEGHWVWDGRGEDDPDYIELVFFGNVMLGMDDEEYPVYEGWPFTFTGSTITIGDDDYEWRYRLSGNTLTITDEYDDRYSYTKAAVARNPLEGIWKVTGGAGFDPGDEYYLLFTGDIMAEGDREDFDGYKMEFRGKTFHPSRIYLGDDASEKDLAEESFEYRVSGRSLTLVDSDGDEIRLTKVY